MAYEYEQLANLYASTLSANYTAGSGVISVTSGSGLPSAGQFALTVLDQSSLAVKVIFRAFYLGGTAVAVTAEGSDNSAASGDIVVGTMLTVRSLSQMFSDRQIAGLLANLPASGLMIGDKYIATDALPHYYRWDSSGSPATMQWDAYIGSSLISVPKIADLSTSVVGTNATRTVWKDQGAAGGGVVLAGTSSNDTTDNWILQLKAYPATPFTVTVRFNMTAAVGTKGERGGIVLYDSVSGKFVVMDIQYNGTAYSFGSTSLLVLDKWNSVTSENSAYYAQSMALALLAADGWLCFQVSDDGTNRIFRLSCDGGRNFVQLDSHLNTDFVTPNKIGIGIAPYDRTLQMSVVDFTLA